jgi:hypothetical protein
VKENDARWFKHDSNARLDPKSVRLRRIGGMAGYGLFWCVVELLREAHDYKIPLEAIPDICFEVRVEEKDFDALFDCGLLIKNETYFFSASLLQRMSVYDTKREQTSNAGKASAQKRINEKSTGVQRAFNEKSTDVQLGEVRRGEVILDEVILDEKKKELVVSDKPKSTKSPKLSDEGFIQGLKNNPAYKGIDIDREIGKMTAWLSTPKGKSRNLTRGFVVNWLNRVDKPMDSKTNWEELEKWANDGNENLEKGSIAIEKA